MANKTITQVPVKKTDLKDLHFYMTGASPTWSALYTPKDAAGVAIGEPRNVTGPITNAAALYAWVDTEIIPVLNTKEGT